MPRAGLTSASVATAAADLADESGIGSVTLAAVAERLGVQPPALYKHVGGIADLRHRIATIAMIELGDAVGAALQGKAGAAAIAAAFTAADQYVTDHPGRYAATTGEPFDGDDDPLFIAATRVMTSFRAMLSAYDLPADDLDHAIRVLRFLIHGYASLRAENAFQWDNDPDESVAWMIRFVDLGLTAVGRADARASDRR